jgi:hypothetical protein
MFQENFFLNKIYIQLMSYYYSVISLLNRMRKPFLAQQYKWQEFCNKLSHELLVLISLYNISLLCEKYSIFMNKRYDNKKKCCTQYRNKFHFLVKKNFTLVFVLLLNRKVCPKWETQQC